ncbi:hypothetical protein, conserved [Angomonas deanei]|uniref:Uncharacterized protein n=1 Tax=Angomonas deanei TaxID=59799 RepID=A0A7G2C2W2_9TRYP|nr:hypothetical protein, conserved [Angomonas deanei]
MSNAERVQYYERLFGYSLKRDTPWIQSPDWVALGMPEECKRPDDVVDVLETGPYVGQNGNARRVIQSDFQLCPQPNVAPQQPYPPAFHPQGWAPAQGQMAPDAVSEGASVAGSENSSDDDEDSSDDDNDVSYSVARSAKLGEGGGGLESYDLATPGAHKKNRQSHTNLLDQAADALPSMMIDRQLSQTGLATAPSAMLATGQADRSQMNISKGNILSTYGQMYNIDTAGRHHSFHEEETTFDEYFEMYKGHPQPETRSPTKSNLRADTSHFQLCTNENSLSGPQPQSFFDLTAARSKDAESRTNRKDAGSLSNSKTTNGKQSPTAESRGNEVPNLSFYVATTSKAPAPTSKPKDTTSSNGTLAAIQKKKVEQKVAPLPSGKPPEKSVPNPTVGPSTSNPSPQKRLSDPGTTKADTQILATRRSTTTAINSNGKKIQMFDMEFFDIPRIQ